MDLFIEEKISKRENFDVEQLSFNQITKQWQSEVSN